LRKKGHSRKLGERFVNFYPDSLVAAGKRGKQKRQAAQIEKYQNSKKYSSPWKIPRENTAKEGRGKSNAAPQLRDGWEKSA